ncbi:MAG: hypothetical protein ACKPKO_23115, partial [Candidatus Fonsibacter sp.]
TETIEKFKNKNGYTIKCRLVGGGLLPLPDDIFVNYRCCSTLDKYHLNIKYIKNICNPLV